MDSAVFEGSFTASQPASWMALTLSAIVSAFDTQSRELSTSSGAQPVARTAVRATAVRAVAMVRLWRMAVANPFSGWDSMPSTIPSPAHRHEGAARRMRGVVGYTVPLDRAE